MYLSGEVIIKAILRLSKPVYSLNFRAHPHAWSHEPPFWKSWLQVCYKCVNLSCLHSVHICCMYMTLQIHVLPYPYIV